MSADDSLLLPTLAFFFVAINFIIQFIHAVSQHVREFVQHSDYAHLYLYIVTDFLNIFLIFSLIKCNSFCISSTYIFVEIDWIDHDLRLHYSGMD